MKKVTVRLERLDAYDDVGFGASGDWAASIGELTTRYIGEENKSAAIITTAREAWEEATGSKWVVTNTIHVGYKWVIHLRLSVLERGTGRGNQAIMEFEERMVRWEEIE